MAKDVVGGIVSILGHLSLKKKKKSPKATIPCKKLSLTSSHRVTTSPPLHSPPIPMNETLQKQRPKSNQKMVSEPLKNKIRK